MKTQAITNVKDDKMEDNKNSVPGTALDQQLIISPQDIMSMIDENPANVHGPGSSSFERMPLELREMVIGNFDLADRHFPLDLRKKGRSNRPKAMSEGRKLLLVSKSMANLVKPMIKNDSIIVFRFGGHYDNFQKGWIRVLDFVLNYNVRDGVPHFASFPNVQELKDTRNFELDLVGFDLRAVNNEWMGQLSPNQHPGYAYQDPHIRREQVRFVCDTIAAFSPFVRHLTVRIPCFCRLEWDGLLDEASKKLIDFLSPLRRLRVKEPVTFCLRHYNRDGHCEPLEGFPRHKPVVQKLEAAFGAMTAEALSKPEQDWMLLKTIPLPKDRSKRRLITGVMHHLLEVLHERPMDFGEMANLLEARCFQTQRES
ncbi:MAG: hypothetical protein Q9174_004742 [Haloplaca sp. 1 TL-2023]